MSILECVEALGRALKKRQWKLVTAESCTGGGLAYCLTGMPGSSQWFDRGFVTYSDASKQDMLGVNAETLKKHGAVSEETAREMAEGALHQSGADVSIAITGIAGPAGGTPEKPVGTVWFVWACAGGETRSQMYVLTGDRAKIRKQSIQIALEEMLLFASKTL